MKKMRSVMILLLLFSISCATKVEVKHKYYDEVINRMVKEFQDSETKYPGVLFFGQCQNNQIALVYSLNLWHLHNDKYRDMEVSIFLTSVFNQELKIDCDFAIRCFNLNKSIREEYESMSFDDFLALHCEKDKDRIDSYWVNNILPDEGREKTLTVIYYLFLNGYLSALDDYMGTYVTSNNLDVDQY